MASGRVRASVISRGLILCLRLQYQHHVIAPMSPPWMDIPPCQIWKNSSGSAIKTSGEKKTNSPSLPPSTPKKKIPRTQLSHCWRVRLEVSFMRCHPNHSLNKNPAA